MLDHYMRKSEPSSSDGGSDDTSAEHSKSVTYGSATN